MAAFSLFLSASWISLLETKHGSSGIEVDFPRRLVGNGLRRPTLQSHKPAIPLHLLPLQPLTSHYIRAYSSKSSPPPEEPVPAPAVAKELTHVLPSGAAYMVPIHEKRVTTRTAKAIASIRFSNPSAINLIQTNSNKKGDVLSISRVAGIMAAKRTSELIPLCHPIPISKVQVDLRTVAGNGLDDSNGRIEVLATVVCDGKTGVEMEALTAAMGAALTVYDMCKAVDKGIVIEGVKVVEKKGGKSGDWKVEGWEEWTEE